MSNEAKLLEISTKITPSIESMKTEDDLFTRQFLGDLDEHTDWQAGIGAGHLAELATHIFLAQKRERGEKPSQSDFDRISQTLQEKLENLFSDPRQKGP